MNTYVFKNPFIDFILSQICGSCYDRGTVYMVMERKDFASTQ